MLSNLLNKIKALRKYLKYNGRITNLTISQILYSECLKGKRIIVTGGSDGIGFAMAKKFVEVGADVFA